MKLKMYGVIKKKLNLWNYNKKKIEISTRILFKKKYGFAITFDYVKKNYFLIIVNSFRKNEWLP